MIQINLTQDETSTLFVALEAHANKHPDEPKWSNQMTNAEAIVNKLDDAIRISQVGYITREYTDRRLLEDFVLAMESDDPIAVSQLFLKVKDHLKA